VIRFFSGNNPINVIVLFFLGILLKLYYFINPAIPVSDTTDGFLYKELLSWLQPAGTAFPLLYTLLSYLLLFFQAVTFNGLINSQKLFPTSNLLLAFSYLLLTSLVPEWNLLTPGLIINTVMVWAWPQMIGLYHNSKPKGNLYNIGFAFGVCSFIYFPAVYYLLLLVVALALFRSFQLSEWLVTITGVLTPFYFLLIYFFISDQWYLVQQLVPAHHIALPDTKYDWRFWFLMALLLVPLVFGILFSGRFSTRMVVQARKSWSFMIFYLLVALFLPFINNESGLSMFILAVVPVSMYHAAFYYTPKRKFFAELFVWGSVIWIFFHTIGT
jgi:hypothetical protein